MKKFTLLTIALSALGFAQQPGDLVSSELKLDLSPTGLVTWVDENEQGEIYDGVHDFLDGIPYGMQAYKITYKSLDFDDNLVNATGLVMFPKTNNKMSNILFMSPTTNSRENVPSNLKGTYEFGIVLPMLLVASEYIVIAPDYLGMGDGDGIMAYVEDKTAASAGLDMLKATDQFFLEMDKQRYNEYFVAGYSQGGHAAMAVNKYNQESEDPYNVQYVAAGAGPYDMSGSMLQNALLDREEFPTSAFIAYALKSCNDIGFTQFENSWNEVISDEYFNQFTASALNDEGGLDWGPTIWRELFQPSYIADLENDRNHPARQCLESNDVFDFYNTTPTTMYSSWNDKTILAINDKVAQNAQRSYYRWWDLGKYKIQKRTLGPWNHTIGSFPYIFAAMFKFNSKRTGGFFNSYADNTGEYSNAYNRTVDANTLEFINSSIAPQIKGQTSILNSKGVAENSNEVITDLINIDKEVSLIEVTLNDGSTRTVPFVKEQAIALDTKDILTINKSALTVDMKNWPSGIESLNFINNDQIVFIHKNSKGNKSFEFNLNELPSFDMIEVIADDAIFTIEMPETKISNDANSYVVQNGNKAQIIAKKMLNTVDIFNTNGNKVQSLTGNGQNSISFELKQGLYIINTTYTDSSVESIKYIQK